MNTDPQTLIDGYLNDALTQEQMGLLCGWIKADAHNADRAARLMLLESDLHEKLADSHRLMDTPPTAAATPNRRRVDAKIHYGPIGSVLAAAVMILAAVLWLVVGNDAPSKPDTQAGTPPVILERVATLTNTENAVFADPDQAMLLGSDLTQGPIHLNAGRVQLMFASTAVVDLIGPCEFEMIGANRGRLTRGELAAYVPDAAHGFTIELPHGARIIDLGTAFRVHVDASGEARLNVTEGHVQILRPNQDAGRLVSAGGHVRIGSTHIADETDPWLTYAGADHKTGGAWRDLTTGKPMDADRDHVYGTAGFVFWNVTALDHRAPGAGKGDQPVDSNRISQLPTYISNVEEALGTRTARDYGYLPINDPTQPASRMPELVESGVLVSVRDHHEQPVEMLAIRLGDDPPPQGFRIGLLVNTADRVELAPSKIYVMSGDSSAEATMPLAWSGSTGEMYFFDVVCPKAGQVLHVMLQPRDQRRPTTLGGLTFDSLTTSSTSPTKVR